jgi:hypothetical protein
LEALALGFFNHQKAAAYARRWAYSPDPNHPRFNPQYPRFPEDCTSFVSQAMLAGGWTMIGGSWFDRVNDNVWWYGQDVFNLARASRTWSGADYFAIWLVTSGRGRRAKHPMELQPGDVIQERVKATGDIAHSMVVTGKSGTDLTLSYHSIDHLENSFRAIVDNSRGIEFLFWKISPSFYENPNSLTYYPPLWSP